MRTVHPYAIDQMIQERREELARLAQVAPPTASGVHPWRRRAGRALVALAVALAVPHPKRRAARCQATTFLGLDPPC